MFVRKIAALSAAALVGALTATAAMASTVDPAVNQPVTDSSAPYCMVDRDTSELGYVTVAGPANGYVTTPQGEAGTLTPVEGDYSEEVSLDAEPYSGILYNVQVVDSDTPVAVDGIICETT